MQRKNHRNTPGEHDRRIVGESEGTNEGHQHGNHSHHIYYATLSEVPCKGHDDASEHASVIYHGANRRFVVALTFATIIVTSFEKAFNGLRYPRQSHYNGYEERLRAT